MPGRSTKPLKITAAVALIVVAMLLVGAGLAAWSTQRTLDTLRWVDHTREVRLELERMLVAVVGAEGSLRGYLLTHDEAFRGSIERSLADATVALAAVDSLTRDNPEQQRRLQEFSVLLTERSAAIRQQVTGDGSGAPTPDALRAMATIGRESLDESRRQIREMEELEDRLMEERAAAARRASSDTGILVALGTLLAVVLVLISIWTVW